VTAAAFLVLPVLSNAGIHLLEARAARGVRRA
jgi:hypothetical protein